MPAPHNISKKEEIALLQKTVNIWTLKAQITDKQAATWPSWNIDNMMPCPLCQIYECDTNDLFDYHSEEICPIMKKTFTAHCRNTHFYDARKSQKHRQLMLAFLKKLLKEVQEEN